MQVLKESYQNLRIKELDKQEVTAYISRIITKDISLKNIPENNFPSQLVTNDIKKMIMTKYSVLTPVEIELALEMERYGEFEKKSEHYQFYGTEYIAEILKKYCAWKFKKANEHNLSRAPERQIEVKPDLEKIEQEFLKTILSEIKANKKFRYIECYLLLKDVPNRFKPTKKQYELLFKQESDFLKLQNDKKNNDENDKIRLKKIIQNQKLSFEVLVKQRVYNIIVCNWLNKTIIQNDKNR